LVLVLAGVAGLLIPLTTVGQNKAVSQESVPMEIGEEMGKQIGNYVFTHHFRENDD